MAVTKVEHSRTPCKTFRNTVRRKQLKGKSCLYHWRIQDILEGDANPEGMRRRIDVLFDTFCCKNCMKKKEFEQKAPALGSATVYLFLAFSQNYCRAEN